ncbi:MAG: hypothetical protein ACXWC4_14230 [Telluria sp.]
MSNFIERCQSYEARVDDIDNYIDEWHENSQGKSLYDFLGMTRQEYALWLADSSILPTIVSLHSQNLSVDEVLEEFAEQLPVAARSVGPGRAQTLIDWLKSHDINSSRSRKS